ncbi:uncharacterized protein LOC110028365 [Phalaenopsis equestris]|uniref:uncharacterized protein LOC110028365 n=1 Tax=Phalaenopsis equestris TaxID=78828 RepID=UPI0009E515C3|nr:uncharacterized protein LOC110028365 [Phalaenopsis equestris]
MAGRKRSVHSPISIGNCNVEVEGGSVICESNGNCIYLSAKSDAKIRISECESKNEMSGRYYSRQRSRDSLQDEGTRRTLSWVDHTFMLLNPKDVDSRSKSLLQEALKLYMEELPTMNYAANTGKASRFLERCLSNGKYSTLIFCSNSHEGPMKVIAAVTFQIIPADTQFVEIPLAAVSSNFQRKGIGCMLYEELKERLGRVGISTLFCWADMESVQFWLKQGFITVGEVDGKGKARKLPVRANIRRALCFPGDATLMVAHLKKDIQLWHSKNNVSLSDTINTNDVTEIACHADGRLFSSSRLRGKRLVWEASVSSLKSKRVKGSHARDDSFSSDQNCEPLNEGIYSCFSEHSCRPLSKEVPNSATYSQGERLAQENAGLGFKANCPRIMLMNIADDDKKSKLTTIVEELGGSVTSSGSSCTHVITGKARRTLNFCLSLCSGNWIVSAKWLKSSFREGKFIDESQYILEDEDYLLKYKCKLRDAVMRAKANPHSLLVGYQLCLSKHIQPSLKDLASIVLSAGGSVIHDMRRMIEPSKTIFVACEEEMEEALSAAKMGVRTFSSEWLMNCVMRQELDLDAHQFAESL